MMARLSVRCECRQARGRRFRGKLLLLTQLPLECEVAIVGAGAAGLATAIFARRYNPALSVVLLEGARTPGAKILVSGGSRCNVTNAVVTDRDFRGGRAPIVRRVLRALPVEETVAFFRELGVSVHEEPDGKLFPDTNRSRDVLDALVREVHRTGATLLASHRVVDVTPTDSGFRVATSQGDLHARVVVLATGGQSLPKSGSDGFGFVLARRLGHTIVPPTPALAALILEEGEPLHGPLSGVAQDVELTIWIDGAVSTRLTGALLWTHIGASGPVAMNASRHWLRAQLEGRTPSVTLNFCQGASFDALDRRWMALADARPTASLQHTLASMVPASVAAALLADLGIEGTGQLAQLSRDARRRLVHALTAWPLRVAGTRGYNYAEATAGGVTLSEIDPATMASRTCPGLYLVGEVLDVDGRIGGFNFQWAWSSARVAGAAVAAGKPPA
jgi:predicted Rossmann fold flavoprotein